MSPRADVSMSPEEMIAFLDRPHSAALSTIGPDGFPHIAGMWFAHVAGSRPELHMWAYAKSQKVRNLERDPRCAFMAEEGAGYANLRGVLVRGAASLVEEVDDVYEIGVRLYERYTLPATGIDVNDGPEIEIRRQASKRKGIVLGLERVASWDHSKLMR
jgi:PPOX class probable F420-dependent enzyme